MGSIVSVKQRARKKTTALTAFGSHLFTKQLQRNVQKSQESNNVGVIERRPSPANEEIDQSGAHEEEVNGQVHGTRESAKCFSEDRADIETSNETKDVVGSDRESQVVKANIGGNTEIDVFVSDSNERPQVSDSPVGVNDAGMSPWYGYGNDEEVDRGNMTNEDVNLYRSLSSTPDSLCQGKPRDVIFHSPVQSPFNQVFSSWGEGVVGTTSRPLSHVGQVTSRGLDVTVKTSARHYDYPHITSIKSPIHENPRSKSRQRDDDYKKYVDKSQREAAAIKIQSHLRGYQARKEVKQRRQSVVKIQRIYRARVQQRLSTGQLAVPLAQNRYSRSRTPSPTPSQGFGIGERTKESFELYQDDISELKWKSQQLIETSTMGENYEPQKILLISSNMERSEWLARVSLQDVHVIVYQFAEVELRDLLENISISLDDYRVGSKAKRIAFVCQGGPGYVYICRGKVLTSRKLQKSRELREFIKALGTFISKKDPLDAKIHFIGSNVLGNKQGVNLLHNIQRFMHPARVSVESPFEFSQSGREMLNEYFNIDLYNIWKKSRYSRTKLLEINKS